jgi:hypothetical protein
MDHTKSRGVYNAFIIWIRFAIPARYLSHQLATWEPLPFG